MPIYTIDEARVAFCQSALAILDTVHTTQHRMCRLIAGHGSRKSLAPSERSVVYLHRALLAELQDAGYAWAIEDEIEGVNSCIEAEGALTASRIIANELPEIDSDARDHSAA